MCKQDGVIYKQEGVIYKQDGVLLFINTIFHKILVKCSDILIFLSWCCDI